MGADDRGNTSIRLTVREFSKGTIAYTNFGPNLKLFTYYFVIKTRLKTEGMDQTRNQLIHQFFLLQQ